MRIFGWSADPGTAYWRLKLPLGELGKRGHEVAVADLMPGAVQYNAAADVLVASRTANVAASNTFQRLAGEARMLCVYEADDDFTSVTPDNRSAYVFFNRPGVQERIRANLAAAHLVTTTGPHLAGVLGRHTAAPVVVLPNRVPRWLTELPAPWEREPGPITVAHTGGPSHVRDFGECAKPLRAWLQRHSERAEFASYGLDSTTRVATRRGRARHVPWQGGVSAYLRSLVGVDIGLAPLRGTEFDRSKSPLKAMEWGALGIPVVASAVEPYASYVRHGVTGFLCSTHREWREALDALTDPELRHRMGLAGRLQACEHLIEDHAHEWLDAYTGAMGRKAAA